jgi:hypothetical protein
MAYAILALLALGLVLYLIAPRYFGQKLKQGLGAITAGLGRTTSTEAAAAKREAHFVNIDGTVRVKKAQSLQWISADYNTNLENGDYIQTGSDGVARIIFADGTNYMLKPDSLIVVEESREDPVTKATRVAVQVSSGAVDLSTGKFEVPGSTSRVSFENATANLAEDSRAMLRNDPRKDVHELTVEQGQASVTRGSTTVQLGQYDQVTFNREKPGLTRLKVISPPLLEDPPNMALTMTKDPKAANLDFAWSHVPTGALRVGLQPG